MSPQVAALLERRAVGLLGAAHLVERDVEILHEVVAVEGDGDAREMLLGPADKCRRHVQAQLGELLGIAALGDQSALKRANVAASLLFVAKSSLARSRSQKSAA